VVGKDAVHHEVKDMMVRADGSSFSAEYWAHPIKSDGKVTGTVVTFVDNSQRDQAIEALAQANLALAQSNQELEQFASIASHDLQEPLRTIRGYLQLVRETLADKLDDRSRDHLERINNGISRLQALISDLLKFSRITAAEMERGPVDMQTLTSRVVSDLGSVAGEHDAEIVFEGLPTVHGNGGLLGQLLQNLIGNAIKYCKAERPMVKIAAERQDGMWRFAVQDNGIGIKPEHQGRIFQIFRRLHAPSEYSGTGVGLAIAKKIVERHTGRIWVESETGQGSTFYFTLPGEDVDRQ
jgi:light-regulated signal transduction histidine kinase (bacteriophytochrome)